MRKSKRKVRPIATFLDSVAAKLRPPFGIALGSPGEVAELAHALPAGDVTCWQMDLFQAERLTEALRLRDRAAKVDTRADLWDVPESIATLLYPVPHGGERAMKLDVIEQAYHVLEPHGTFIVISPYDHDDFFAGALKKVFGRPHVPMDGDNQVFWCQRTDDRPRRRHETNYHVRIDAETSYSFLSRPGVFGYGFYDEGARALMEAAELLPGQRVLDLGCGVGTNGILAARRISPEGHVTFVDSNARAVALADLNAKAIGVQDYRVLPTHTLKELDTASFDAVLANPPYYAQGTILHHFIDHSHAALRPGGEMYLVTKMVDLAWPMIQERFAEAELYENRGYVIFRTKKSA
jgi:16S rRNA G1207 methylase RsmC